MASTVERLLTRQVPKSVTGSEAMFKVSSTPMTGEDVLFTLGQIQRREPVGALVLDAQIADSSGARARLVGALHAQLMYAGKEYGLAYAIAEAAVHEVVDTHICTHCKGVGHVLSKRLRKMVECKHCRGVGRIILNEGSLLRMININLPKPISQSEWVKQHYDDYMDAVDTLRERGAIAAGIARRLLDGFAFE